MEWSRLTKTQVIAVITFYIVGYQVILSSLPYAIVPVLQALGFPKDITMDVTSLIFQIIGVLIFVYMCKDMLKVDFKKFKENWKEITKDAFKLYLIMYVINFVINVGLTFIGSKSDNKNAIEKLIVELPLAYNFMAVIAAPIIEELVFRAAIFRTIYFKNKNFAYFISSFLFGLFHVISSVITGSIIDFLYISVYIIMALFMAKIYDKHKTIIASMLYHFINNGIAVLLLAILKMVGI